ncbi:hypothetical protein LJC05_02585 [Bacteroides sp. OttesenSCG-928-J23]|nr:hypothetical protein [Bacteroides sp. OttesenSCG-928-N06]MDL2247600.1 hypothetical protein [Bacteroides sp. OttesenSCG-928-J23]MDL2305923.1 hypothetical protein [Bacteroides sp. OttesenSCG-928-D19]
MEKNQLSTLFLDALNKIRFIRPRLVHEISDLLDMDEVSVYRRLRGAVRFTTDEMGLLAHRYHISLDNMMDEQPEGSYESWKMDFPLTVTDRGFDLDMIEQNIPLMREFLEEPLTETGGAIGFLTRHFFMKYRELARFALFKWGRYYSNMNSYQRYDTVQVPDRLYTLFQEHIEMYSHIKHTFYIWDSRIISRLVNDIQYFRSMTLISDEGIARLKQDLHQLLDDCESMAAQGQFLDTGNSFELHISPIDIDTSQVYMRFGDYWLYTVEVFGIRSILTFKPHVCADMARRINQLKLTSILISNSGEKERVLFFKKQREMVEGIKL